MKKLILILFILLALVLTACQSSTPTEVVEATAKAVNTQPPADISSQAEVSEPTATKASDDVPANESAVRAKCTVVSRDPTPGPTEESIFAPVSESDWVRGPDSAAVTIIEYSDFQ
ncbi:MAG: hypothetical protein MUO67_25845 [Anaerolineales bacterium]|nr:hypothetical protein [Anaerolineales bacterium]